MPWVSSRSSSSASAGAVRASRHDRRRVVPIAGQLRLEQAERHRDRDEPLLRPVVKVSLDPAALGVGGLDQPPTRGVQLDQARAQLRLEPLVLERESGGGAHRLHEVRVVLERRVVQQHRDRRAVALDERRAPVAVGAGDLDRAPVAGHVAGLGREPVREVERGVTERPRERSPQVRRLSRRAQLDDETGDAPAGQPPPHERRKTAIGTSASVRNQTFAGPEFSGLPSRSSTTVTVSASRVAFPANSTQVTSRRCGALARSQRTSADDRGQRQDRAEQPLQAEQRERQPVVMEDLDQVVPAARRRTVAPSRSRTASRPPVEPCRRSRTRRSHLSSPLRSCPDGNDSTT